MHGRRRKREGGAAMRHSAGAATVEGESDGAQRGHTDRIPAAPLLTWPVSPSQGLLQSSAVASQQQQPRNPHRESAAADQRKPPTSCPLRRARNAAAGLLQPPASFYRSGGRRCPAPPGRQPMIETRLFATPPPIDAGITRRANQRPVLRSALSFKKSFIYLFIL